MSKKRMQRANAKGVKAEADRRFRAIAEQVSQHKGQCLFPMDANGGLCPEPRGRRHVIPRSSVLDRLKDPKSGKVLDIDWSVDQWSSLLLKSDEQHPLDLDEPTIFNPRLLGTHEACTGLYACQTHDAVFNRIDTATPDFGDSHVRWLTMGRIALYAADLCSWRRCLVDTWKWNTMRGGNKGLRAIWMRESQFAYTAYEKAHSGAKWWGDSWKSLDNLDDLPDDLVDWSVLTFRSRLRMAACIYYGEATAVVVLPRDGDEHMMALLHWSDQKSKVIVDEERLRGKARETETGDEYGVDIVSELMSRGSGTVAASPVSYRELAKDQRIEVQKIVMRGLEATGVAQALRDDPPGHGAAGNRRYRDRR